MTADADAPTRPPDDPFATVLVGDDGRDGGRAALALARTLAPGADLVLAGAYPYDDRPSRLALAAFARVMRDDAEQQLARTREEAGVPEARLAALADGSPARGLHRLAEAERADLLVLGSSHRGPVGRILLGDVARDALHGAPCPVAVAPRGAEPRGLQTIGVAYDGSAEAEEALATAAGLARARGARLDVLYVAETDFLPALAGAAFDMGAIVAELQHDAQALVDAAVARAGVPAQAHAVTGSAAERLDELAARVDLLVCGSRGWGAVRRVVLGSTADRLIHHAPCPVLVVPRSATEDDRA